MIVYDIEIYKNFLLFVFYNIENDKYYSFPFLIGDDNNQQVVENFKIFFKNNYKRYFVGYNNLDFDDEILNFFIFHISKYSNYEKVIYETIKFGKLHFDKKAYFNKKYFKSIDSMKVNGFDNKARMTSLKQIEFNLRLKNIKELPYPPNSNINKSQVDNIVQYCKHDVYATTLLLNETKPLIEVRKELSEYYNIDLINKSDIKMGETIFQNLFNLPTLYIDRESFEKEVNIKDIIFDYIHFNIPVFNKLKEFLESKSIITAKNFFTDIPFEELELLKDYYKVAKKKGKQKQLNIIFRNLTYYIGSGGIHASQKGIFKSNSRYIIIDLDVSSYYPSISIVNKLIPEKLLEFIKKDDFLKTYSGFKEKRKKYPKSTHFAINFSLKILLNVVFGKSLQPSSIFGDLKYGLSTTINGQLMLLMLIEQLVTNIPDIDIIQANTDGITVRIDREYETELDKIKTEWERLTKLELEKAYYSAMYILNVNNYIAVYENGKIKSKGKTFAYKDNPHHKDHSEYIVPMALEQYLVYGKNYKDFILNHKDIYDFCKRVKIKSNSNLYYRTDEGGIPFEQKLGKITRYIMTVKGGKLVKILPPLPNKTEYREELVEAEGYVTILQDIPSDNTLNKIFKLIDYKYYINKVEKIIKELLE